MKGFVAMADYQRACDERDVAVAEVAYLKGELGVSRDLEIYNLLRSGFRITYAETRVLHGLYVAKDRFLSRDALHETINGATSDRKIVDVYVSRLRRKLGFDSIETLWGAGYRLSSDGRVVVDAALAKQRRAA